MTRGAIVRSHKELVQHALTFDQFSENVSGGGQWTEYLTRKAHSSLLKWLESDKVELPGQYRAEECAVKYGEQKGASSDTMSTQAAHCYPT